MRAIYYDTETTGIRIGVDRIVELAAYDPLNDTSFVTLINPGIPIPKEASNIHHITDDMVKTSPSFADILPSFIKFCEGNSVLIAHNNDAFDFHFLKHEHTLLGQEMPQWNFLDSLKWARKYRPDLPRHTLQFLREAYGFPANNAHRALDDVIILHKVFSTMIDDLPLKTALELLQKKSNITHMPFGKYQGKPLSEVPKDYVMWLEKNGALEKPENLALRASFDKIGIFT